jgi:hypothetical protein
MFFISTVTTSVKKALTARTSFVILDKNSPELTDSKKGYVSLNTLLNNCTRSSSSIFSETERKIMSLIKPNTG